MYHHVWRKRCGGGGVEGGVGGGVGGSVDGSVGGIGVAGGGAGMCHHGIKKRSTAQQNERTIYRGAH